MLRHVTGFVAGTSSPSKTKRGTKSSLKWMKVKVGSRLKSFRVYGGLSRWNLFCKFQEWQYVGTARPFWGGGAAGVHLHGFL